MKSKGLIGFLLSSLFVFMPLKKIYSSGGAYTLPLEGIPKKFRNHQEGKLMKKEKVKFKGNHYGVFFWDTDNDQKWDVAEFYGLLKKNVLKKKEIYAKIPFMYAYDLNGDGQYSDDEILIDYYMDRLNNNEYWMDRGVGFV